MQLATLQPTYLLSSQATLNPSPEKQLVLHLHLVVTAGTAAGARQHLQSVPYMMMSSTGITRLLGITSL